MSLLVRTRSTSAFGEGDEHPDDGHEAPSGPCPGCSDLDRTAHTGDTTPVAARTSRGRRLFRAGSALGGMSVWASPRGLTVKQIIVLPGAVAAAHRGTAAISSICRTCRSQCEGFCLSGHSDHAANTDVVETVLASPADNLIRGRPRDRPLLAGRARAFRQRRRRGTEATPVRRRRGAALVSADP